MKCAAEHYGGSRHKKKEGYAKVLLLLLLLPLLLLLLLLQVTHSGDLALLGRDGRISLHRPDLSSLPRVFDLQHYQAGGVIDAHLTPTGHILSVSGEGSLVLFLRQEPLDYSPELDKAALAALHKMPPIQVTANTRC